MQHSEWCSCSVIFPATHQFTSYIYRGESLSSSKGLKCISPETNSAISYQEQFDSNFSGGDIEGASQEQDDGEVRYLIDNIRS